MSKTYKDRKITDPKTWKLQKSSRNDRHMFYSEDLFQVLFDEYAEMYEDTEDEYDVEDSF